MTNEELEMRHQEVLANAKPDEDGWDMYYCRVRHEDGRFGEIEVGILSLIEGLLPSIWMHGYEFPIHGCPSHESDVAVYLLGKVPRWEGT